MIIVTGAGRSGTSFVSHLLHTSGIDFGPSSLLYGADKWNAKGYFENKEVLELNVKLFLGSFVDPRHWTQAETERKLLGQIEMNVARLKYLLSPPTEKTITRAAKFEHEIQALSKKYENVALKDPRFSVTIGCWMKYGKVDKVLYIYRNPVEVAKSVRKRVHLPLLVGYRLWVYHVTEFLKQIQGLPIMIVKFNNFFDRHLKSQEMARIDRFLSKNSEKGDGTASQVLDNVLDNELRHHLHVEKGLPTHVERVYYELERLHDIYSEVRPFEGRK